MYHALVSNIKSITEFANTNPVTEDITSSLDKDKFELYVASQYLEYAKSTGFDKEYWGSDEALGQLENEDIYIINKNKNDYERF